MNPLQMPSWPNSKILSGNTATVKHDLVFVCVGGYQIEGDNSFCV